ncbi:MAG: CHAT domain-containing protein [Planctomycetaceae bacterium]|jgi:tetratricopeptide (TPR) repeat protein|nr:CHAT domain-containing protein [Planctomycetaceae bacterium]
MKRLLNVCWLAIVAGFALFVETGYCQQVLRVVPNPVYFDRSLNIMKNGDFDEALDSLNVDLRGSVKMLEQNLWLDSICYNAQIGECYYQKGDLNRAMKAFSDSLLIYLKYSDWLVHVSYSGGAIQSMPRPAVSWGKSARTNPIGSFAKNGFTITQTSDRMDNIGGTLLIQPNNTMVTIHAGEIVRSLAMAIRRRGEILGTLSRYDPLNAELVKVLGGRPCRPNDITGSWVDVLYGLALSATEQYKDAETALKTGLVMEGRYDHQLTPLALFELGKIALLQGKGDVAYDSFFEASVSAMVNDDQLLMGEAFVMMANAYRLVDKSKPCLPIGLALTAARQARYKSNYVITSLVLETAEQTLTHGDVNDAASLLKSIDRQVEKSSLAVSWIAARYHYLTAMANYKLAYQTGKAALLEQGHQLFGDAMQFMSRSSLWLNQLNELNIRIKSDQITTRSALTIRAAGEIFERLLSPPTTLDWLLRPMEAMAATMYSQNAAYEHWFFIARERGDKEKAFEIAENARYQRFYSALPLGPRMMSLRMLFEGNPSDIPPAMLVERQSLSIDFAQFAKLSERIADIKRKLLAIPVVPKVKEQADEQRALLEEMYKISVMQEAMLAPIALSRISTPNVFPVPMKLEDIRAALPEKTSMLVFFDALGELYGFLLDKNELQMWVVSSSDPRAPTLRKLVTNFLESLGNKESNANQVLTLKNLDDTKWKTAGNELLSRLIGRDRQANFSELVIVPTGILWYVPFEAMCVQVGNDLRPFISAASTPITMRYAPTAVLGVPQKRGRAKSVETTVVQGKIWTRKEDGQAELDAIDRYIKQSVTRVALLPTDSKDERYFPIPANVETYATQVKQLLVLDDVPLPKAGALDWSPFTSDKRKGQNTVSSWLQLPWGGPRLLVMPAFHTPAETALRVNPSNSKLLANGDELFVSAMTLEACGAQTILMSRWRTGGRASLDLVGEFLKGYHESSAAEAWYKAVMRVATENLVVKEEPRLKIDGDPQIMASHPFFWSPFILIDRGEQPITDQSDEPAGDEKGELEKL